MRTPVVVAAILVGLTAVLVVATTRVVPAGAAAVVTRFGRVRKVTPSGIVALVPLLDRLHLVRDLPTRTEPVVVLAQTNDGADVRVSASLLWQVEDAEAALLAIPSAASATEDAVERGLHRLVRRHGLATLLHRPEEAIAGLSEEVTTTTRGWGVRVLDVTLLDLGVRAGPELRRLLR